MNDYRNDVRHSVSEARWTIWHASTRLVLPVVLVGSLLSGSIYLVGVGTGLISSVANPERIVTNYEWFQQQYQDIKAIDKQIILATQAQNNFKNSLGPRDKWSYQERDEVIHLANIVMGLKQQRESMVAAYNSRASMLTRSGFKSRDLPDRIGE